MMNASQVTTILATAFALPGAAFAAELCVVCAEPAMAYRCALEGDTTAGSVPSGLQLLCIKELATRGGHKRCSVDRAHAVETCTGALVTLARPADLPARQVIAPTVAAPAPAAPNPATPATDAPPATVEALAKETAEQSKKDWDASQAKLKETTAAAGQTIEKTGNAVGSAVKKSWDCIASLFARC